MSDTITYRGASLPSYGYDTSLLHHALSEAYTNGWDAGVEAAEECASKLQVSHRPPESLLRNLFKKAGIREEGELWLTMQEAREKYPILKTYVNLTANLRDRPGVTVRYGYGKTMYRDDVGLIDMVEQRRIRVEGDEAWALTTQLMDEVGDDDWPVGSPPQWLQIQAEKGHIRYQRLSGRYVYNRQDVYERVNEVNRKVRVTRTYS